jgi:hypothetical protein
MTSLESRHSLFAAPERASVTRRPLARTRRVSGPQKSKGTRLRGSLVSESWKMGRATPGGCNETGMLRPPEPAGVLGRNILIDGPCRRKRLEAVFEMTHVQRIKPSVLEPNGVEDDRPRFWSVSGRRTRRNYPTDSTERRSGGSPGLRASAIDAEPDRWAVVALADSARPRDDGVVQLPTQRVIALRDQSFQRVALMLGQRSRRFHPLPLNH